MYQTNDIQIIKAKVKEHFVPQHVKVSSLKLFFASIFNPEVALLDHAGPPVTATFERIADYLRKHDDKSF